MHDDCGFYRKLFCYYFGQNGQRLWIDPVEGNSPTLEESPVNVRQVFFVREDISSVVLR